MSLLREDKVNNIAAEVERMNSDIVSQSEVRWSAVKQIRLGGNEMIYSGSETHTGVAIMVKKDSDKCLRY